MLLPYVNFEYLFDEIFVKIATYLNFAILENESNTDNKMKHGRFGRIFVTFYPKSKGNVLILLVTKVKGLYSKEITIFS